MFGVISWISDCIPLLFWFPRWKKNANPRDFLAEPRDHRPSFVSGDGVFQSKWAPTIVINGVPITWPKIPWITGATDPYQWRCFILLIYNWWFSSWRRALRLGGIPQQFPSRKRIHPFLSTRFSPSIFGGLYCAKKSLPKRCQRVKNGVKKCRKPPRLQVCFGSRDNNFDLQYFTKKTFIFSKILDIFEASNTICVVTSVIKKINIGKKNTPKNVFVHQSQLACICINSSLLATQWFLFQETGNSSGTIMVQSLTW